jgi:capsular polysaccharide biosynthesis protein
VLASNAIVVFPAATHNISTLVVVASSDKVLAGALSHVGPPMSLQTLRGRVQAKSLTSDIISIGAQGKTAVQAESTANAVADSFVAYVSSAHSPGGQVRAQLLEPATDATGTSLSHRLLVTGGLGALFSALLGAIAVIRRSRSDRRFRMT